jgi:hypothetical protein
VIAPLVSWLVVPVVAFAQGGAPPKEWNQPHGNAASTAFVDVAPLTAPPTERWKLDHGTLLAGPVVSQQKLFVVVRDEGRTQLLALDPATGNPIAKTAVEGMGEVFAITAGEGLVSVVDATTVSGYRLANGNFQFEKSIAGSFAGEPTLAGSNLFVPKGRNGGVQWIDWTSSKCVTVAPKGFGRPAALLADKFGEKVGPSLLTCAADDALAKLSLLRFPLLDPLRVKLGPAETLTATALVAHATEFPQTVLVAFPGKDGANQWCAWFGSSRGSGVLQADSVKSLELKHAPAAREGKLYGFDAGDRLVVFEAANGTNPIVEKERLPKGAQVGAPSIARDVLFLGNWALELGTRRVLWCLESLEADGPAIPCGDELLVVKTKSGKLVGYGNGSGKATPATGAGATVAAVPPGPATPEIPGSKPGVIRSDGVFVPGKATLLESGRWKLLPDEGKPYELEGDGVALVDDGKEAKRFGEEMPLFKACNVVPAQRHVAALVTIFEKWRDAKLYEDARRVLDEAKRFGMKNDQYDELVNSIAGKASAKLADKHPARKKCGDFETDTREETSKDFIRAAKWCAARDAKVAATVLVTRAAEISPKNPPDPDLLESWTPESFPADPKDRAEKPWPVWAEALLPSGATFKLDDELKRKISVSKWNEHTLWIRTRNILLLSKESDPAVIGPLLQRGEATIRALQKILGPSPDGGTSVAPLEVRLHRTRSDYLADRVAGGSHPDEWSAGCFSPMDGVSRFYSEVGDKHDEGHHELQHVFAHELTHHYVERRWINGGATAKAGGYWMVEGVADFVSEQALEIGRLGERFDDATVNRLDLAAAANSVGKLIPLEHLLEIDPVFFHQKLNGGPFGPLKLKHTLSDAFLDERLVFYAESATFSFFVMNRCGEKGRAAYVDWLVKTYRGDPIVEPWKTLGFEDMAALRKAFLAFVASI